MNYLTELLAFYRWLETNPVSPLLQSYWHLLMYYNNKAAVQGGDGGWYWPVCFSFRTLCSCAFEHQRPAGFAATKTVPH